MDNYKETPEAKNVKKKYADILHLSRPEPSVRHPRMDRVNRAKLFSPFSALRGYDDEVRAEVQDLLRVEKKELSEEDRETLSQKIASVQRGMSVAISFFVPTSSDQSLGSYQMISGVVEQIDSVFENIRLYTGEQKNGTQKEVSTIISFEDILMLDILD
mgnify:CR=1 FL=1